MHALSVSYHDVTAQSADLHKAYTHTMCRPQKLHMHLMLYWSCKQVASLTCLAIHMAPHTHCVCQSPC